MTPAVRQLLFGRKGWPGGYLGLTGAFNYVIDASKGDDANAGSASSPWKTLSKITPSILSASTTTRVLVKAGTYSTALDYVNVTNAPLSAFLEIVYEPGCVLDGTLANPLPGSNIPAHEFGGTFTFTTRVYGNGVRVNNYHDSDTGTSPNGFGNRNTHILYVYDAYCDNCDDGFSAHDAAQMYTYDCSATNAEKGSFVHVGTSYVEHWRCNFSINVAAVNGAGADTVTVKLYDCVLTPTTASSMSIQAHNCYFERCQIGTMANSLQLFATTGVAAQFVNCFLNGYMDGNSTGSFTNCFGKFSTRCRNAGAVTVDHCVFTGPSTAKLAIIYSDTNFASMSKLVFKNTIAKTTTAALFMNIDATNAGYMVSSASQMFNNALNGSAAYDADLIAADTGPTVRISTLTTDVGIGSPASLLMADYAYPGGSAAIGAGTSGSNIGFGASTVAERQTRNPALP